jgi:hypothetical protein
LHNVCKFLEMAMFNHSISFINHQISHRTESVKIGSLVLDMLEETTRCGNDNIRPLFQKTILLILNNEQERYYNLSHPQLI